MIADDDDKVVDGTFKRECNFFIRVVGIAMQNCVNGAFSHRHGDLHDLLFVKASLGRHAARRLLGIVHRLQRRIERIGDAVCGHRANGS